MDVYLDEGYKNSQGEGGEGRQRHPLHEVGNVVDYSEVDPTEGIKLHLNEAMLAERDVKAEDVAEAMETGKRNAQLEKGREGHHGSTCENADLSTLFTLRNKLTEHEAQGHPRHHQGHGRPRERRVGHPDRGLEPREGHRSPRSGHEEDLPPTTSTRSPRSSASRQRAPPSSGRS